jgi:hypothetical protein
MTPILKSVSMSAQLIFAPKYATMGALGAGLGIWVFTDDPLIALAGTITLWLMGVTYGLKDPHFIEVFLVTHRIRKTRNLYPSKEHFYAA